MRLRNYFIIAVVCALLFIAWVGANAYTTDSEITPKELDQWSVVLKSPQDVQGFYYIVAENPELRLNTLVCPIKFVLICIDSRKKKMVAYAYYRDDELMVFEIKDRHFQRIYSIVPEAKRIIDWFLMPFLKKFKKSTEET